jgi:hypothetical protein
MTEPNAQLSRFVQDDAVLRTAILGGVCICLVAVAYSIHRYPTIVSSPATPVFLSVFLAGVLWYGFAAVRWTRVTTREDFVVLRHGATWGILIGLAWTVEILGGNVIVPHEFGAGIGILAALAAAIMPVIAGAIETARTGHIRSGACAGFWSGVVSGVITFIALASVGYLVVTVPGFPGVEVPRHAVRALTANELAAFNIGEFLAAGVNHLVIVGAPFCSAAGAFGGVLGRAVRSDSFEERATR